MLREIYLFVYGCERKLFCIIYRAEIKICELEITLKVKIILRATGWDLRESPGFRY